MYLIFINGLGADYKGNHMYEFIFTDEIEEVWDETWNAKPSNGYPKPPDLEFIKMVGVFKNSELEFELIQNSDFFSFSDAIDTVIALGWEKESLLSDFINKKRLVFHFGDTEEIVKNKLYERDIVLEFEKQIQYEYK